MNNLIVFEKVSKEFFCDANGKVTLTQRGLASLCGVDHKTWKQNGSYFTHKIDRYLIDKGIDLGVIFDENNRISDLVAGFVIKYYAYQNNKTAQQTELPVDFVLKVIRLKL